MQHPDYNSKKMGLGHDIALIKLRRSINFERGEFKVFSQINNNNFECIKS